MDLVGIVSLVNLLTNLFRASCETMASDPEGQLSDQSDIRANSEVSEIVTCRKIIKKDGVV